MTEGEGEGGGIGGLFGKGSTAEQFLIWGVLQQIIQPLLNPATTELGKLVNSVTPVIPLSAQEAADLVARKLIDHGTGYDAANDNGTGSDDFNHMITGASHAADLGAAIAAYQRGLIGTGTYDGNEVSLNGALADAGVREAWTPILEQLATQIPTVAEVMNAWLEGQITEDEAHTRYLAAGGDPTWFQTSYDANGQAPTPSQALELLNRGIIGESGTGPESTSYEQAFLEGPWRNKWLKPFEALRYYLPPPRTVTAMYHGGQLTHDTAASLLVKQGLTAELAAAYLSPSHSSAAAADKHLAKGDLLALYADGLMSRVDAISGLEALKYSAHDAALIVELQDVRTSAAQVTAGVTRTRTLYNAGKLTDQAAEHSLALLGIATAQAKDMVDTWAVTDVAPVRVLSASQIDQAWGYGLISTPAALAQLEALGYDPHDAWILLSIKNKGPIKGTPEPKE